MGPMSEILFSASQPLRTGKRLDAETKVCHSLGIMKKILWLLLVVLWGVAATGQYAPSQPTSLQIDPTGLLMIDSAGHSLRTMAYFNRVNQNIMQIHGASIGEAYFRGRADAYDQLADYVDQLTESHKTVNLKATPSTNTPPTTLLNDDPMFINQPLVTQE